MIHETFECSVLTPEEVVFQGDVKRLVIPAHDGQLGILPSHAPMVCKLGAGRLRLHAEQGVQNWFVEGGVVQIADNRVSVLTEFAVRPEQLDREHTLQLLKDARSMPTHDEQSRLRREHLEASARAQLHMLG